MIFYLELLTIVEKCYHTKKCHIFYKYSNFMNFCANIKKHADTKFSLGIYTSWNVENFNRNYIFQVNFTKICICI